MMLCAFALAALTYSGRVNIAEIVLLAFVTGTAMSLNTPSYQALVPELVPREDLSNAIALNSAQFNLSRVIGPTLGGFAMAAFGVAGNFLLNGLSFLAVLLALLRIDYPPPEPSGASSLWQDMTEGFRYLFAQPAMSTLLLLIGICSILGFPFLVFVPLFARDILHVAERGLGLLMACSGTGAFLGAATIAYLGRVRRRGRFVMASCVLFFLGVIAFSFSRNFLLSGIVLLLTGYVMILMVATVNTLLQHLASDEMRGRVMSMYATAFLGFAPLGSLMAGSLAGAVTAPYAIAIMCALGLVASLWIYFSRDALRRLD
jgi:predicted MFS family arabinose efflux permease